MGGMRTCGAILKKTIRDFTLSVMALGSRTPTMNLPTIQECICKASASVSISSDTLEIEHGSGENILDLKSCSQN